MRKCTSGSRSVPRRLTKRTSGRPPPRMRATSNSEDFGSGATIGSPDADRVHAGLVELALVRGDRKDTDQRQKPALPGPVENRVALGHRVDHRRLREERDYECGVKPRLVVGRNDVGRLGDVLDASDDDPEQVGHDPEDQAPDEEVEARRLVRIGVDKRVERSGDELPVLGAPVTERVGRASRRGIAGGRG